jgi:hypothetical protein
MRIRLSYVKLSAKLMPIIIPRMRENVT